MLQLATTTDKLQLTTSASVNTDVHVSYVDHTTADDNVEGNRQNTAITTATTTDILAAPASGVLRRVKVITIRNKSTTTEQTVTVIFDQNGTDFELAKFTLAPHQSLQYTETEGFFLLPRAVVNIPSARFIGQQETQAISALATRLWGSHIYIPNDSPLRVGSVLRWRGTATKTAAGTTTGNFTLRHGVAGQSPDAGVAVYTFTAGTAAADTLEFLIVLTVRGALGAACPVQALAIFRHHLQATGFFNQTHHCFAVNGTIDTTLKDQVASVSVNPAGTAIWTMEQVMGEILHA